MPVTPAIATEVDPLAQQELEYSTDLYEHDERIRELGAEAEVPIRLNLKEQLLHYMHFDQENIAGTPIVRSCAPMTAEVRKAMEVMLGAYRAMPEESSRRLYAGVSKDLRYGFLVLSREMARVANETKSVGGPFNGTVRRDMYDRAPAESFGGFRHFLEMTDITSGMDVVDAELPGTSGVDTNDKELQSVIGDSPGSDSTDSGTVSEEVSEFSPDLSNMGGRVTAIDKFATEHGLQLAVINRIDLSAALSWVLPGENLGKSTPHLLRNLRDSYQKFTVASGNEDGLPEFADFVRFMFPGREDLYNLVEDGLAEEDGEDSATDKSPTPSVVQHELTPLEEESIPADDLAQPALDESDGGSADVEIESDIELVQKEESEPSAVPEIQPEPLTPSLGDESIEDKTVHPEIGLSDPEVSSTIEKLRSETPDQVLQEKKIGSTIEFMRDERLPLMNEPELNSLQDGVNAEARFGDEENLYLGFGNEVTDRVNIPIRNNKVDTPMPLIRLFHPREDNEILGVQEQEVYLQSTPHGFIEEVRTVEDPSDWDKDVVVTAGTNSFFHLTSGKTHFIKFRPPDPHGNVYLKMVVRPEGEIKVSLV